MPIIRDGKKLHREISGTFERLRKVSEELSLHAISVVWHLGMHRNPTELNFLFKGLNKNMQAGFKRWAVEVSMAALREAGWNDVNVNTLPFRFTEKDGFSVVKTEKDEASVRKTDAIAKYMEANENTVGFGDFMNIDPDKTKDPFSVLSIIKTLKGLVSKTDKADDVSNSVKLALAEMVKGFETKVHDEVDLAETAARLAKFKAVPAHTDERPSMTH